MKRELICAANWKLNKTPNETREFFKTFKTVASTSRSRFVFFPSAVCLEACAQEVKGSAFEFGLQNCHFAPSGAFTGENSAAVAQTMGAQWCLIGHSERRSLFGETDDIVSKKFSFVQSLGLRPLLCVGETLQERESGVTESVIARQLRVSLEKAEKTKPLTLAYEPVWAIGTGKVASPDQAASVHAFIASELVKLGFRSDSVDILYGGSVKADNAGALSQSPHIAGFLVGGASLDVKSFLAIADAAG